MKLVIIWSNGDKQKITITEEAKKMIIERLHRPFDEWSMCSSADNSVLNLQHARELYIEE